MPKQERQEFSRHGTRQAYEKGWCRCVICRKWKKKANRAKWTRRMLRKRLHYCGRRR